MFNYKNRYHCTLLPTHYNPLPFSSERSDVPLSQYVPCGSQSQVFYVPSPEPRDHLPHDVWYSPHPKHNKTDTCNGNCIHTYKEILHCTALHRTALHHTALYCTVLHCIAG